jgi:hypothetical protein
MISAFPEYLELAYHAPSIVTYGSHASSLSASSRGDERCSNHCWLFSFGLRSLQIVPEAISEIGTHFLLDRPFTAGFLARR